MALIRRRKASEKDESSVSDSKNKSREEEEDDDKKKKVTKDKKLKDEDKKSKNKWSCVDSCCWFIGCICTVWWLLIFMYNAMPASFPQYVTEAITGPLPDPPGVKLGKEGLTAKHPVVFVPGIVTCGLELWEGHQCAEGLFRKRLWGGTFGEVYKRYGLLRTLFVVCGMPTFRILIGVCFSSAGDIYIYSCYDLLE